MMTSAPGLLVLVVGPSGVGKDTLIEGARLLLEPRGAVFPHRDITRAASAGGEAHVAVSEAEFEACRDRGDYALWWRAHGLAYGVRAQDLAPLASGSTVILNVSRSVLDEARARFPRHLVVLVTADPEKIRQRLVRRGRETPAEIEERVGRAKAFKVAGGDVATVQNDASPEAGIRAFIQLLASAGAPEAEIAGGKDA